MLAVDTNIVVRFLVEDDAVQASRARALFQTETVLLAKTVLLETEWVLRRLYRIETRRIADAFSRLLGLPNLTCEDANSVSDAISWMRAGMDFADALHLTAARPAGRFATFDRRLASRAARLADVKVVRA